MDSIPQKQCTRCKEWFPATLEYFAPAKHHSDGLTSQCRLCGNEQSKRYYKVNLDEVRERHRRYREANREKFRRASRHYREAHPNKIREQNRRYHEANREKYNEFSRRWAEANPDKRREINGRWRKANPDKKRAIDQRRIARKAELLATLTAQEWEDIKADFNYCCAYCGKAWHEIEGVLQQEHVIPVKLGGPYIKENIVPACKICNRKKGAKTPEEAGMPIIYPHHTDIP
jgi:5-methylcytosine-specific restriction endonuclease McrA